MGQLCELLHKKQGEEGVVKKKNNESAQPTSNENKNGKSFAVTKHKII